MKKLLVLTLAFALLFGFGNFAMAGHTDINLDKPGHGYDNGPGEGPGQGNGFGHNKDRGGCEGDDCVNDTAEAATSASDSAGFFGLNGSSFAASHGVANVDACVNLADPSEFHFDFTRWGTGLKIDGTITPMIQADAFAESSSFADNGRDNGWGTASSYGIAGTESSAWTELRKGEQIDKTVSLYLFGWKLGSEDFSYQDLDNYYGGNSHVHVSGYAEQSNANGTLDFKWGSGAAVVGGYNESDAKYKGDGYGNGWSEANGDATVFGATNMYADQTRTTSEIGGISMSTGEANQSERRGYTKVTGSGFIAGSTNVYGNGATATTNGLGAYSFENKGHYNTGATGQTTISGFSSIAPNGQASFSTMNVQSIVTSAPSLPEISE